MAGSPVLQFTKTKTFRISTLVVLLVGLYALAGFVLVPRMLRSALMEDIPKSLGVTPAVGEIRFNPFLLQLDIRDVSLAAANGEKLLGFRRLFVDFELSSIWHRAYSFANIDIDRPSVNAIVARDGNLNLLQLQAKTPAAAKPDEKKEPFPALRIGSFNVSNGLVTYEDHSRPSEFAARLEPINFKLVNFTTGADGGQFTFTGSSEARRASRMARALVGAADRIGRRISNRRVACAHDLGISGGPPEFRGQFRRHRSQRDVQVLAERRRRFAGVGIEDRGQRSCREAEGVGRRLDYGAFTAAERNHGGSFETGGARRFAVAHGSEARHLARARRIVQFAPAVAQSPAAQSPAAAPPTPRNPAGSRDLTGRRTSAAPAAPPWKFDLRELALREASISAEDRSTSPAVKVLLAPLSLTVGRVSLDLGQAGERRRSTRASTKPAR